MAVIVLITGNLATESAVFASLPDEGAATGAISGEVSASLPNVPNLGLYPISGAEVILHKDGRSGQVIARKTTDAGGNFFFDDLPAPARYYVEARHPDYEQHNETSWAVVDVEPDTDHSISVHLVMTDRSPFLLNGYTIRMGSTQRIPDVRITARDGDQELAVTYTDIAGEYGFRPIETGGQRTIKLTAEHQLFEKVERTITLQPAVQNQANFELRMSGDQTQGAVTFDYTVENQANRPDSARLIVKKAGLDQNPIIDISFRNFYHALLPAGEYKATLVAEGFEADRKDFTIVASGYHQVSFDLRLVRQCLEVSNVKICFAYPLTSQEYDRHPSQFNTIASQVNRLRSASGLPNNVPESVLVLELFEGGQYDPSTNIISIGLPSITDQPITWLRGLIAHEMGHAIDDEKMTDEQRQGWMELYQEEFRHPKADLIFNEESINHYTFGDTNDYASTNESEKFAELTAVLAEYPGQFQRHISSSGENHLQNPNQQLLDLINRVTRLVFRVTGLSL